MPPINANSARNLNALTGDPASVLALSRSQANNVASNVPNEQQLNEFNNALLQLLRRHQQLGTRGFAQQEFAAREAQANRQSAQTPASLIGAAPGIQASARSAQVSALQPTISGAQQSQQTFGEQIRSYGDSITNAKNFLTSFQAQQDKIRDDARNVIKDALTIGGADALKGLNENEISQLEKTAGYPKGYVSGLSATLKERELELKRQAAATSGFEKLTTTQKTSLNDLDAVLTSLEDYRALYNALVGSSGINLTGSDAGQLSGAYNALLFQIARAAGTGALQAADREVVEAMIPNPTTVRGGVSSFFRGAKTGGGSAITEAKKIFLNRKAAIQNSVSTSAPSEGTIRVRRISDGQTGSIPASEFDDSQYERI